MGATAPFVIEDASRPHPDQRNDPDYSPSGNGHKQASNNGRLGYPPRKQVRARVSQPIARALYNVVCHRLLTHTAGIPVHLTRTLGLDRWAWYRTIGTEYAAIALLRPQRRAAAHAIVKDLTSVSRHGLRSGSAAVRACNDGCKDHCWLGPSASMQRRW